MLPADGHVIVSQPNYGYPMQPGRHKVLIWSREPWRDIDPLGSPTLPSGRFVAATTDTPVGAVRFFGVCVPWRDAHVRTGRRDRQTWQDHLTYLQHLGPILAERATAIPGVLLGDLNQRVPRAHQPGAVFDALTDVLSCEFELATAGQIPGTSEFTIDHLAVTRELAPVGVEHLDRYDENGVSMSDHFGLRVFLKRTETANKALHLTGPA